MADSIETIVNKRLDLDDDLHDDAKLYVMAALDGTLDAVIEGGNEEGQIPRLDTPETPAGAYLRRMSVAGFRGIGPRAALDIAPGPGLTLVVGANGTGKSSFAEGLEFLLTGENSRWQGKSAEWRQGWRNLHAQDPPELQANFAVDGQPGRRRGLPPLGVDDRRTSRTTPSKGLKTWSGQPRWTPTGPSSPTTGSATSWTRAHPPASMPWPPVWVWNG